LDRRAHTISAQDNRLYIGGNFEIAGGVWRAGFAVIDAATGKATPRAYNFNGSVRAVHVDDSVFYVGGTFGVVDNENRGRVAIFDKQTGNLRSENLSLNGGTVLTFEKTDSMLYVGGTFTSIGPPNHPPSQQNRFRAAAYHLPSHSPNHHWTPSFNNQVRDIKVKGDTVFLAGWFTTVRGQQRTGVAAVNAQNGALYPWNAQLNNAVYSAMVIEADTISVGGNFMALGDSTRGNYGEISVASGQPHANSLDFNGSVLGLDAYNNIQYMSGAFTCVDGQCNRQFVASFDRASKSITSWNPNPIHDPSSSQTPSVYFLKIVKDRLFVSGRFIRISNTNRYYFAVYDLPCTIPDIPIVHKSADSICPNTPITLNIVDGNLQNAANWYWYAGGCGGTPIDSGAAISVSPDSTTEYFVRGAGNCVFPASCASVTVHVNQTSYFSDSVISCGAYIWPINSQALYQSGTYVDTVSSSNGCDSIVTLELSILSTSFDSLYISVCDSFEWRGHTYFQSGQYSDTLINVYGCDSILNLYLTIYSSSNSLQSQTACEQYVWNGGTYFQSGTYIDTLVNASGCDSLATLQLTIHAPINDTVVQIVCDSIFWNGMVINQSGAYTYTGFSQFGCDSIVTLLLTVNESKRHTVFDTACQSLLWNGQFLNSSGIYTHQMSTIAGCDSVITLNLTIQNIAIDLHPQSQSVYINVTVSFSVLVSTSNPSYQWQTDTGDGFKNLSNSGPYHGVNTSILSVSPVVLQNNQDRFRCVLREGVCEVNTNFATLEVIDNLSSPFFEKLNAYEISPNPTRGTIFIHATTEGLVATYKIVDKTAKVLGEGVLDESFTAIDFSNYASGIYFLEISTSGGISFHKVIKI
jgi:hypothetical protein